MCINIKINNLDKCKELLGTAEQLQFNNRKPTFPVLHKVAKLRQPI